MLAKIHGIDSIIAEYYDYYDDCEYCEEYIKSLHDSKEGLFGILTNKMVMTGRRLIIEPEDNLIIEPEDNLDGISDEHFAEIIDALNNSNIDVERVINGEKNPKKGIINFINDIYADKVVSLNDFAPYIKVDLEKYLDENTEIRDKDLIYFVDTSGREIKECYLDEIISGRIAIREKESTINSSQSASTKFIYLSAVFISTLVLIRKDLILMTAT